MLIYEKIMNKEEKLSLVGLGYVGLPIAVAFAKKIDVIGFDVNDEKINLYKNGIDPTKEVGNDEIKKTKINFTNNPKDLKKAKFHIVAVPTPVDEHQTPDLRILESATKIVAENLTRGSYVVFESTVYPGVTEEICVPILEKISGLKLNVDFKVGFSPERINPGDKVHRLETIVKIVSGSDDIALEEISKVYEMVVEAGVYKASSIKVAEVAKVIENAQRDINIAFMNELSLIFNKLDIDTTEVLKAAGTKWNFLNFFPGLVGGHCIGVDPYYLTYKAKAVGYHPEIILAGRKLNDHMGIYVAQNVIKQMINAELQIKNAKVGILGFTFKENTPDTRNTRVIDIYNELKTYGVEALICDPVADAKEALHEYGLKFNDYSQMKDLDVLIFAVAHDEFKVISNTEIEKMFKNQNNKNKVLVDIKGILEKEFFINKGYNFFKL